MKVGDAIRLIQADGWYQEATKGKTSHRKYKHPDKAGSITISCHRLSDDLKPGTWHSIQKQAGPRQRQPMIYGIIVEKGADNYSAYVQESDLAFGCVIVTGDSLEAIQRDMLEALAFHLADEPGAVAPSIYIKSLTVYGDAPVEYA